MERKFKLGDRVVRDSDGCSGTVTFTEFYRSPNSTEPFWVRIKWDRSNSRSDRTEEGLRKATDNK